MTLGPAGSLMTTGQSTYVAGRYTVRDPSFSCSSTMWPPIVRLGPQTQTRGRHTSHTPTDMASLAGTRTSVYKTLWFATTTTMRKRTRRSWGNSTNTCFRTYVVLKPSYEKAQTTSASRDKRLITVFQLTIYGMCTVFSNASDEERVRRKAWVKEKLTTISSQLLNGREVLKEASLCQLVRPATNVSVWWSNLTCLPQEVSTADRAMPCFEASS